MQNTRAHVSIGTVGALAPMLFESVDASTHSFSKYEDIVA